MPLKYQDVVNNPEYKDKLDKLNQKRIDRLQSEYDKFALTGSRDSGDKTLIKNVKKFIKSENNLLRGASIWSLRQLMTADEFAILKYKNIALEKESDVKKEWI